MAPPGGASESSAIGRRRRVFLLSCPVACAEQGSGNLPARFDSWDCLAAVEPISGTPSAEEAQDLNPFGSRWEGTFSLAIDGSADFVNVPVKVHVDFAAAALAERATPEDPARLGTVTVLGVPATSRVLEWVGVARRSSWCLW